MNKVKIGIVGSGGMGRNRTASFSQRQQCKLVALASRNVKTGSSLAKEYGIEFVPKWQEIIERADIDAVVICTHNESHGEIAVAALSTGKHVFMEYPLARYLSQGEQAVALAKEKGLVLRLTHRESLSPIHKALKDEVSKMGELITSIFVRLTPGRGARPEILFNLKVSGPPALFFIYHVYPAVDLFGKIAWVEGGTQYEGLNEEGIYDRFANTVNVGVVNGGLGQWTWAGGIEISEAEEYQRCVLTDGTLVRQGGNWIKSTSSGIEEIKPSNEPAKSLEDLFLDEVTQNKVSWQRDAETALEAIRLSLAAEQSAKENRRVSLL
ncbi:MAG: Gfo/Idh/MocA family protein [Candidatus Poribacteria bacterium]